MLLAKKTLTFARSQVAPQMNKTKRHFSTEFKAKVAMAALKEEMAYSLFFDKKEISVQIAFARISGSSQPELPYFGIALWRGGSRYIRLASRSCASSFLGADNSHHHP
jgi:hypothetical protein